MLNFFRLLLMLLVHVLVAGDCKAVIGFAGCSCEEIGDRLHVTQERVQQIEVRALRTLRTLARQIAA